MRDDFSKGVIETLAKRAGFRCSNPDCTTPTIGAAPGHPGVINLGEAAHITAASMGGKRFLATLTPAERAGINNGIWLCGICAKLVDRDDQTFPVELLRRWKAEAEDGSFRALTLGKRDLGDVLRQVTSGLIQLSELAQRIPLRIGSALIHYADRKMDVEARRQAVGEIVQWGRLRDGAYDIRQPLLTAAITDYVSWSTRIPAALARRHLPVFWIDGRSGDGKSVLLLQLADTILRYGEGTLIFQASMADFVPDVIEHAKGVIDNKSIILVLVDDLHKVSDAEKFSAALILALNEVSLPIAIIACGPTPERQYFERQYPFMEVHPWTMPPIDETDIKSFGAWFDVDILPDAFLRRSLLVEVLFSAQIGEPVQTFAKNFGARLRSFGLFERVCQMAALNAADVGVPHALIGEDPERDAIERLAREDQLHFEQVSEMWGWGVRIAHSAIAWRLFEHWSADPLRDTAIEVRLARVFVKIMGTPDLPRGFSETLLARAQRRLQSLLELADAGDTRAAIARFWAHLLDAMGAHPDSQALVVISLLEAGGESDAEPINAGLVKVARDILSDSSIETGRRALVGSYLSVLDRAKRIPAGPYREQSEALCLEGENGFQNSRAVRKLISAGGSGPDFFEKWCRARPRNDKEILTFAVGQYGATPALCSVVTEWLRANWDSHSGIEAFIALLRKHPDHSLDATAIAWCEDHWDHPQAGEILSVLCTRNRTREDILDKAFAWIVDHSESPNVASLASVLLGLPNGTLRTKLRPLVGEIIRVHIAHSQVANLLPVALRVYRGDQEIAELGAQWFSKNRNRPISGNVLPALLRSGRRDAGTAMAVLAWARENAEMKSVPTTLSSLAKLFHDDVAVLNQITEFCEENIDKTTVFNTLSTLLRLNSSHPRLKNLAQFWALENRRQPGSASLLSSLLLAYPNDLELIECAVTSARSDINNRLTGALISTILLQKNAPKSVCDIALVWMDAHEHQSESQQLLSALISSPFLESSLEQRAERWLDHNPHRPVNQVELLASLIEHSSDPERWVQRAIQLIERSNLLTHSHVVLDVLARTEPHSERLRKLVSSFIAAEESGIRAREAVLETWIEAGGVAGPALDVIYEAMEGRDRQATGGQQLFGICARVCARKWETVLARLEVEPALRGSVCYLVGKGIPSVHLNVEACIGTLNRWPKVDVCYVLAGLLRTEAPSGLLMPFVSDWLKENWRNRGYGVVLKGIADRSKREVTFPLRLPEAVRADILAMAPSGHRSG